MICIIIILLCFSIFILGYLLYNNLDYSENIDDDSIKMEDIVY